MKLPSGICSASHNSKMIAISCRIGRLPGAPEFSQANLFLKTRSGALGFRGGGMSRFCEVFGKWPYLPLALQHTPLIPAKAGIQRQWLSAVV